MKNCRKMLPALLATFVFLCVPMTTNASSADSAITNPVWYSDYDYSINSADKTITLENYNGLNDHVYVKNTATIDGIRYNVLIDGDLFKENSVIKAVSFGQGCKVSGTSLSFEYAEALEYVNFYGLDTSNVESFKFMFSKCYNLKEVRLGGLDTSKVTSVAWMFLDCSSLKKVDLSNLDFSNVEKTENMFLRCELEELITPSVLPVGIKLPYFFVADDDNDGIMDNEEEYKVLTAGTEQTHLIMKSPVSGTEYMCIYCHIVKDGDDYYLYPYGNNSYIISRDTGDDLAFKDRIKIAKNAIVGVSNKVDVTCYGDEYISVDFNPEYYPFYKKVDELFETKHWSEEQLYSFDEPVFSFYTLNTEQAYFANMPLIAMNDDGEIVLIEDHLSE